MTKSIGILTGGGDVPGLNPCIKAVVMSALEEEYRVFGITRGWGGCSSTIRMNPPHTVIMCVISKGKMCER
jgi:6-phosphofructokinase